MKNITSGRNFLRFAFILLLSNLTFSGIAQLSVKSNITTTNSLFTLIGEPIGPKLSVDWSFPDRRCSKSIIVGENIQPGISFIKDAEHFFDWDDNIHTGLVHDLRNSIKINPQAIRLKLNFYTKNVSKIIIALNDKKKGWFAKEIEIANDGYQLPIHSQIINWILPKGNDISEDSYQLDQIGIIYCTKKKEAPSRLIIGNFEIEHFLPYQKGENLPWLDSLVGSNSAKISNFYDEYSKWSFQELRKSDTIVFSTTPMFESFALEKGLFSGLVEVQGEKPMYDEVGFLNKFMLKAIDKYPFYQERSLDEKKIKNDFDRLSNEKFPSKLDYWKGLREFVQTEFSDPHFEVIIPDSLNNGIPEGKKSVAPPISLKRIMGDLEVSAVFIDEDRDILPLGSSVLAIDGRNVNHTSDLPFKRVNDSVALKIQLPDSLRQIRDIKIPYVGKFTIGKNFVPIQCEFRQLKDSIVYFRINHWTEEVFYSLLNHHDEISASKGLIIDLRGNGGGFGDEVYRVLGLFFNQPQAIGSISYADFKESIVILPQKREFRFPQKLNISIIIDDKTACGSEIFLVGMKLRPNTFSIGDSNSRGATANPCIYRFPSGEIIKMHTIYRKFEFDKNLYQEGTGIKPDILISKTSIRDMYPYEDKSLQSAFIILRSKNS